MIVELFLLVVGLLIFWDISLRRKWPKNMPPGPLIFPIIGNVPQIAMNRKKTPFETFHSITEKYGPITFMKLGVMNQVILEDYDNIKELLNSDIWIDRFYDSWIAERAWGKILGVLLINASDNECWKEMRRFSIRTLRDFGFGKQKSMESTIEDELREITESLDDNIGKGKNIINMKQYFTISVLNVLWSMIAGERFSRDDPKLEELIGLLDRATRANAIGSAASTICTSFPPLKFIVRLVSQAAQERDTLFHKMHEFFRGILQQRRALGTYKDDQKDFIDVFLKEIDSHSESCPNIEKNLYTDEQFIIVIMDLFFAGSETTSNTMEFAILYMILNPEVQRKVQEEIDNVVGRIRFPSLSDKSKMHFTEATLHEIQRLANVVPINARACSEETKIGGYNVPKGTVAILNKFMMHTNPKVWENPFKFDPGRFLDSDGKINPTVVQQILPFGAGKRMCLGEQLARASFFTFFTRLLQKYNFEVPPGDREPRLSVEYELGFTLTPKMYSTLVTHRST